MERTIYQVPPVILTHSSEDEARLAAYTAFLLSSPLLKEEVAKAAKDATDAATARIAALEKERDDAFTAASDADLRAAASATSLQEERSKCEEVERELAVAQQESMGLKRRKQELKTDIAELKKQKSSWEGVAETRKEELEKSQRRLETYQNEKGVELGKVINERDELYRENMHFKRVFNPQYLPVR